MLFIAEIGMNHNGNLDLCNELVRQAKWAGADIAKFQLGWRANPDEINHITPDDLKKIEGICKYYDIEFMASIITEEGFELSRHVDFNRFKIASRTVIDKPNLVHSILKIGKPTFLSLGMWTEDELPFKEYENVTYMWCKSLYPTYPWDLKDLPKNFNEIDIDGFSDHSVGIEIVLTAIARGATVIEKHFTLDKSDTTIRDHGLSATPEEFRLMVNLGRNIYKNNLLGI